MKLLTLIIPSYNESKNIPLLLEATQEKFSNSEAELLIVDNGSTDETPQVLEKLLPNNPFARSIRVEENQGYGFGILSGLQAAKTEFIGWTHADLQTDPSDALKALEIIKSAKIPEKTFVKGKRFGRPLGDSFFTFGMSCFETLFLKQTLWDINAQPNLFHRTFFESWKNPPHDFSLDLFVYYQASKEGYQVERFPVYFGERVHGHSHWNLDWKSKIKFIRRTIDFSLKLKKQL